MAIATTAIRPRSRSTCPSAACSRPRDEESDGDDIQAVSFAGSLDGSDLHDRVASAGLLEHVGRIRLRRGTEGLDQQPRNAGVLRLAAPRPDHVCPRDVEIEVTHRGAWEPEHNRFGTGNLELPLEQPVHVESRHSRRRVAYEVEVV